eukprot:TRINITY_DN30618_c0_g1_i1.p1 TRINITY_DN30618_c0_g1~~TRINITY_DN30618_c0_g1_i1.p1  ORF type:complete len:472 (+),score=111.48 TRINITY_DN30618_c0_g1_i1:211-1626(+)
MSELLRRHVGLQREVPPWRDIRFKCSFHNTVYDVLKARGFRETDDEVGWDIFWCDKEWIHEAFDHTHLQSHQKVNHFRNHYELTRKDLLVKNLKRAQRQAQRDGLAEEAQGYASCSPITFFLPTEYSLFVEEFKKQQANGAIWIMKPIGKSQGKGIFLFNKLSQVADWKAAPKYIQNKEEDRKRPANKEEEEEKKDAEPYVVQRYLSDPLLIGGKKFDLRLYVLVTSYVPLIVYMYRSGFARFSHSRFTMNDISDAMVHLTNVAVQKQSENYDDKRGGKWDLHDLKMYLYAKEQDREKVDALFCAIQEVVIYSLLSVQKVMIQDKHCFELYGYDIMISSDLKPWLIEVNASPSLSANTPNDYDMKFALLDDTFTVLDFEKYLEGSETQIGGFDLLYRNGVRVGPPSGAAYTSFLGCSNNRMQQLRRLSRSYGDEERLRRQQQRLAGKTGQPEAGPSEKSRAASLGAAARQR